jgi:hypothetical protein
LQTIEKPLRIWQLRHGGSLFQSVHESVKDFAQPVIQSLGELNQRCGMRGFLHVLSESFKFD